MFNCHNKEMKERKYAETKILNHETFKKYRFMSFEARPTDKLMVNVRPVLIQRILIGFEAILEYTNYTLKR